jgi:hypothetical protein
VTPVVHTAIATACQRITQPLPTPAATNVAAVKGVGRASGASRLAPGTPKRTNQRRSRRRPFDSGAASRSAVIVPAAGELVAPTGTGTRAGVARRARRATTAVRMRAPSSTTRTTQMRLPAAAARAATTGLSPPSTPITAAPSPSMYGTAPAAAMTSGCRTSGTCPTKF